MNNNLLSTAIHASISAGKAIMEIYNTDFKVVMKEDSSPLTLADEASNTIINFFLKETGIPIISEENEQLPYEERKDWDMCWLVDPLDGTKEFVKRNGEFTVNIALVKDGKPIMGVIYVPVTKTLYYATYNNEKAYKTILENHEFSELLFLSGTEITRPLVKENKIIKLVGSRSHMNEETSNFVQSLKDKGTGAEIVAAGSSLKFCLIAEGKADVYPRFAPTMEWDTAAGQAICEAAGAKVLIKDSTDPLHYNKKNLLNPHFIVS